MPEVLRKTVTFRSRTPQIDSDEAAEILEQVGTIEPPADLTTREVQSDTGDSDEATAGGEVVLADHEPETADVIDADSTILTARYDDETVHVQFRASEETLAACIDVLEQVLEVTTLETGEPPESSQALDVQVIVDSPMEPYEVSPPERMLFRTKRTPDGRTALRVVVEEPLELTESADAVADEAKRGLSLADQV